MGEEALDCSLPGYGSLGRDSTTFSQDDVESKDAIARQSLGVEERGSAATKRGSFLRPLTRLTLLLQSRTWRLRQLPRYVLMLRTTPTMVKDVRASSRLMILAPRSHSPLLEKADCLHDCGGDDVALAEQQATNGLCLQNPSSPTEIHLLFPATTLRAFCSARICFSPCRSSLIKTTLQKELLDSAKTPLLPRSFCKPHIIL